MMKRLISSRRTLVPIALGVVVLLVVAVAGYLVFQRSKTTVIANFPSAVGIYEGDPVKILGVQVGSITSIEPGPDSVRVAMRIERGHPIPAGANAAIVAQGLVSERFVQFSPVYTGGEVLAEGADIPLSRTVVPMEWDDFRVQIERLADSLGPTAGRPQGSLGSAIDTAARNLDGQGANLNSALTQLSDAVTTLADGREDLFAMVRNLQVFIGALAQSDAQVTSFNQQMAAATSALSDSPDELLTALQTLDGAVTSVERFVRENKDAIGTTAADLGQTAQTLADNQEGLRNILHIAPTAMSDYYNIYQPAQGAYTGALAAVNFANPVQFICSAIGAAAQVGAERAAELCKQQLGPVLANLTMNFPPVGMNPVVGPQARPGEVDYSEPSLRPSGPPAASVKQLLLPGGAR